MAKDIISLTKEKIHIEDIVSQLSESHIGALATFVGIVRKDSDLSKTNNVEYTADKQIVLPAIGDLCLKIRKKWSEVERIAIVHRIGKVAVGDTIVVIAVSSAHRGKVFDCLHYAIDQLRKTVPILKK